MKKDISLASQQIPKTLEKKSVIILGSTGSIGQQTLDIIASLESHFEVYALSCQSNADLLIQQAKKFKPDTVVIGDEKYYQKVQDALWEDDVKVFTGTESLEQIVTTSDVDIIVNALIGFAGLKPSLKAIEAGKRLALANKESLVVAGPLIVEALKKSKASLIPIDSEHSALFQCLVGEFQNPIEKVYLTASGGPFLGKSIEELEDVTPEQAVNHPTWKMGAKISVDSATMINKGFEMIEAQWLFGIKPEQIEIVLHPQSIIHGMVQFEDGSIKTEMGVPDMRVPIQYALTYPDRHASNARRLDLLELGRLMFEKVPMSNYPNFVLAQQVLVEGGIFPCVLNAANEIAVSAFLERKIGFNQIYEVNSNTLSQFENKKQFSLNELVEVDIKSREIAKSLL